MPIDPDALTGDHDPERTVGPSSDDDPGRTRVPSPPADPDRTIGPPATADPDRTIGPAPAGDPDRTIGPAPAGDPDRTIGPGADDGGVTIAPAAPAFSKDGPLQPGTRLGTRYTILKLLGRGGMGAVYHAYDDELSVAVAIKTILPGHGSTDDTRRDQESRFKSELLLARQVTHKNVVRIHDLGEHAGLKYITMTFVEGQTLGGLSKGAGPLPVRQAMSLARQIADGLAAAHEVGVVHRDLKPENIMVTPDEQALIMDFGIASSSQAASQAGVVVGTIEYMAPEQARGKSVDGRADIYAYGLILHDILTGRKRFDGHDKAMAELLAREKAPPPPVRSIRPEIPEGLDAIVTRATQPAADDRFADVKALQAALAALDEDGEPIPIEAPRARWPALVAGVVVTALAAGGTWWATRPEPPKDPVSVLIADFQNRTGDPVFDGVVEQALGLGIESASFVTAYPRRDALRVAAGIRPGAALDEETARLVALREGVTLVLAGAVEPDGSRYRISTRALAGGTEEATELYALNVEADGKDDVLEAVGRLAGDVRERLGDTEVPRGGPATNETFTAASLEAARAYATAQELQWAGKGEDAIAQYRETLALDPDMGRAHSGLAAQYANLGRNADAEAQYQEALARIDRMTDREKFRTRGSYYLFARKPDLAMKEFTALVEAYPADSSGLTNLALAAFYQRDMTQALEQGRRSAAIFPRNVLRRSNVALYAMYAGQFETAITEADAVHELNPAHVKAFVARALSLLALGRVDEAKATYETLAGQGKAGASYAAAGLADIAHYQGRLADAAARLADGIAADLEAGNTSAAASKRVALAEVRLAQGNQAAAVREASQAAEASDADAVRAGAAFVLAAAGRATQADALARTLVNRLEADPQAYGRLVRAELALRAGESRAAVEHAREAQKLADTWPGRVLLGRAYLALEAFPEAYSEFEAALNRKGEATALFLDDVPSYRHLAPVHYYLGRAQAGLRSPAAAESFKTFLALKEGGDEQGLVADARARLDKR